MFHSHGSRPKGGGQSTAFWDRLSSSLRASNAWDQFPHEWVPPKQVGVYHRLEKSFSAASKWVVSEMKRLTTLTTYTSFKFRRPTLLLTVVVVGTVAFIFRVQIGKFVKRKYTEIVSQLCSKGRRPPQVSQEMLRKQFRNLNNPHIFAGSKGHTHPKSAASRTATTTIARMICANTAFSPLVIQGSLADKLDGLDITRVSYWMKDLNIGHETKEPGLNRLIVLTDVDYYMDMPDFMVGNTNPILLYTCQPTSVAHSGGEYSFSFGEDNKITYRVSGGATYQHKVWCYSQDTITVTNWRYTTHYLVERRQADPHHEYVLLVPDGNWAYGYAYIARLMERDSLHRFVVNAGAYNALRIVKQDGVDVSVGKPDELLHATVPQRTLEAIRIAHDIGKMPIGAATVQTWLEVAGYDDKEHARECAVLLTDYTRALVAPKVSYVYPVPEGVRSYELVGNRVQDTGQDMMITYMSPIVPEAWAPTRSRNNEVAAVIGRILAPQKDAQRIAERPISRKMIGYMEEFAELLIPCPHVGRPLEIDEVYDRQARPSQRAILDAAEFDGIEGDEARAFLKNEAAQKPAVPRIITTFKGVNKRDYASYIYSFADFVTTQPWYAFGKTPLEIAETVAQMAVMSKAGLNCSDLRKMDGHVHEALRLLEKMCMFRYFSLEERNYLLVLMNKQCNVKSRFSNHKGTRQAVKYPIDWQRGSGSLETAIMNSTDVKFLDYCNRRDLGIGKDEAFYAAGLFGGDDGIASEVTPENVGCDQLVKTAAMFGQSVEVMEYQRGEPGVNFLSRFYSRDLWNGDTTSTCDLARILSKLHVTPNKCGLKPLDKLKEKLSGLALTDRHTPIISELVKTAERVGLVLESKGIRGIASWWSQYSEDVNWPNRQPDDYGAFVQAWLPDCDVTGLFAALAAARRPIDLLTLPCVLEKRQPKVTVRTIVEDTIMEPNTEEEVVPAPNKPLSEREIKSRLEDEDLQQAVRSLERMSYSLEDDLAKLRFQSRPLPTIDEVSELFAKAEQASPATPALPPAAPEPKLVDTSEWLVDLATRMARWPTFGEVVHMVPPEDNPFQNPDKYQTGTAREDFTQWVWGACEKDAVARRPTKEFGSRPSPLTSEEVKECLKNANDSYLELHKGQEETKGVEGAEYSEPPTESKTPGKPPFVKIVCDDYVNEKCLQGKSCPNAHVAVCRNFYKGKCTRPAGTCKFHHVAKGGRAPLEI
jgi:hypothetical protein